MRRRLFVSSLVALLLAVLAPDVARAQASAPTVPTLVGIRAAHHPTFDRVVFDFRGGLPSSRQVRYVDRLIGDASGLPVPIAGQAVLQVTFSLADAHDDAGRVTAPGRVAFPLPNVMSVVRSGDFEAVLTHGIGLAKRQAFRVFTLQNPPRVVVDVDAAFRTVPRRVWFFDQDRFLANQEPFFVPVWRRVLPFTPATGVMDRIFAGPTAAERAAGLRFLSSRATDWTNLSINVFRVARVQLVGGCSSGGSTVSIAGHIMPTLRQFDSVDWVKILGPLGRTERPFGQVDSIPECLEP